MIQRIHDAIKTGASGAKTLLGLRLFDPKKVTPKELVSEARLLERITEALGQPGSSAINVASDLTFFVIDSKLTALNHGQIHDYSGSAVDQSAIANFVSSNIAEARRQGLQQVHSVLPYCEHTRVA